MKKTIVITIAVLLMIGSLGAMAYPLVSNYLASKQQEELVLNADRIIANTDNSRLKREQKAAERYNKNLLAATNFDDMTEYNSLLNLNADGIMGVLDIPAINVALPIYHGTEASVLSKGIGHVYGTSLPVGGESTHAVLSGHSGMMGNKMLSDITALAIGDTFSVRVLGKTLHYTVDQILTVLPYETDAIAIKEGEDYLTLITCVPFGVNTHRLLVRGTRTAVEETPDSVPQNKPVAAEKRSDWYTQYIYGFSICMGAALLVVTLYVIFLKIYRKRRK